MARTEAQSLRQRVADGSDFRDVNAMGQVPVLRTDDGALLTENPAVLQYVADRYPQSGLAPQGGFERYGLQQWLNFITSELHKVVFIPLLDPKAPEGAKSFAREKAGLKPGEAHELVPYPSPSLISALNVSFARSAAPAGAEASAR